MFFPCAEVFSVQLGLRGGDCVNRCSLNKAAAAIGFAVGYLEGISLIRARRLVLTRTKMEKLVPTSKITLPSPFPTAPACRLGIRASTARNQAGFFLLFPFFFPPFEKRKFCSRAEEGGKSARVIFTVPFVVVTLGD